MRAGCLDTRNNREMFVDGSNILSIQDEHALSRCILCSLGTDVVHYCMKSSPGMHAECLDTPSNREMFVEGSNILSIQDEHALSHCILCSLGTDVVDCCMKSSPGMHADYLDTQSNREMFVEGSNML